MQTMAKLGVGLVLTGLTLGVQLADAAKERRVERAPHHGTKPKQAVLRAQDRLEGQLVSRDMAVFPMLRERNHHGQGPVRKIRKRVGKATGRALRGAELAIYDYRRDTEVERIVVIVSKARRLGKRHYASKPVAALRVHFDHFLRGRGEVKAYGLAKKDRKLLSALIRSIRQSPAL